LCDGGLSNRFNSLIFALVLRNEFGGEWRVSWPINNWCGAGFAELFTCPLPVDDAPIEYYKAHEQQHLLLFHDNQIGFAPENLVINTKLDGYSAYAEHFRSGRSIVYYNNLIPSFASEEDLAKALALLRPNAEAARRATEFCLAHGIDHRTQGVHIRKTDFTQDVDDEALFRKVRGSRRRFFVCSDSAEINERFAALPNCAVFPKTAFPEKVVEDADWHRWTQDAEGRWFPYNISRSATAVVEALIDQLILSQTATLDTSHSSFLSTARLFQRNGFLTGTAPPTARRTRRRERAEETRLERRIRKWRRKLRRWVRGRERSHAARVELLPTARADAPSVTQGDVLALLAQIRPWRMKSDVKVRIGGQGDGGYVMPSSARHTNTVLAIGIGDEVSFDEELAGLGARVLQFDHTVAASPSRHPGCEFHRLGWGARDDHPLATLSGLVKMVDWSAARHPILKFDVEGAEWEALAHSSAADLARFEILTGEFHHFDQLIDREFFERVRAVFRKLNETHRVIHLHANNAGGMVLLEGVPLPRLLEMTWVRIDSATFEGHSDEPIPGPLDRPNLPHLPDLQLRPF
jgi:hypothetical protein